MQSRAEQVLYYTLLYGPAFSGVLEKQANDISNDIISNSDSNNMNTTTNNNHNDNNNSNNDK